MPSVSRQSTATPNNIQEHIYSIVCCCISTTLNTAVPSMLLTIPFPVNERTNVFCCSPIFFSRPGGSKPPSSYRNIINFCLFLLNVAAPFLWSHLLLLLLPPPNYPTSQDCLLWKWYVNVSLFGFAGFICYFHLVNFGVIFFSVVLFLKFSLISLKSSRIYCSWSLFQDHQQSVLYTHLVLLQLILF